MDRFEADYRAWMKEQIGALTDDIPKKSPSEWAEEKRYLPQGVTAMPGYYSYDVSPYLREIIDCLDTRTPIREVSLMKGAQVGATTGVLENVIGYCMEYVKNAPVCMVTADDGLAKKRMEKNISPMIDQSDLSRLIRSGDSSNNRKSGKTDSLIEWIGGGSLAPLGAQNPDKFRSDSIQFMLMDEVDGYPLTVGSDGCPMKLAESRTKGFHQSRKILRLSTPKLKGQSKIQREFDRGDKRYYNVPCKDCGKMQILRFKGKNEHGEIYGLIWEMDTPDRIKDGSVRYKCQYCGFLHRDSDKTFMLPRGVWVPTAQPASKDIRSYHLSALYSPAGMYSWTAIAEQWVLAWDDDNNKPRNLGELQVFYNNDLGEVFEARGDRISFSHISSHRRHYQYGQIPNKHAENHAGSEIMLLTCAVDVHNKHLDIAVFGWTQGRRAYVIEYLKLEGDATDLGDTATWGKLSELIETKIYSDGNGKSYGITLTLVDAGHNNDLVISFCEVYTQGVIPILGRSSPDKKSAIKEFSPWKTALGTIGYKISVDLYKDRWGPSLRRSWSGMGEMPIGHFNAPSDMLDKEIRELTTEYKREKKEKSTGRIIGYEWYRPSGVRNELWDLLVYNSAALEIVAWDVCINQMGAEHVLWTGFFDYCRDQELYFNVTS